MVKIALLCVALVAGLSLSVAMPAAAATDAGGGEVLAMQAARQAVAGGDLTGAIARLREYVRQNPGEPAAQTLLGDLYYRAGEINAAQQQYEAVLSYDDRDREVHNRLGAVYAIEGRVAEAIKQYTLALPDYDSVPSLVALHERAGDLNRYRDERTLYAQQHPNDQDAQIEAGQIYEAIGEPEKALLYFTRVLSGDPLNALALNEQGVALMSLGDYAAAKTSLDKCLLVERGSFPCTENLAADDLEWGRYDAAGPLLQDAFKMRPERAETLVNMGYLADARNDWKKGVSYYLRAMQIAPLAPEAYIDLGSDYEQHGLYKLAESAIIKGLAMAPYDARLHYLLADTYAKQGQSAKARDQFHEAEQTNDAAVREAAIEALAQMH